MVFDTVKAKNGKRSVTAAAWIAGLPGRIRLRLRRNVENVIFGLIVLDVRFVRDIAAFLLRLRSPADGPS